MSLSNFEYWQTISKLKDISIKTLILGGGGYNPYITAKAWAGNWLVLNSKENLLDTNLNEIMSKLIKIFILGKTLELEMVYQING